MLTRYLVEGYTADEDATFIFSNSCKSVRKARQLALLCQQSNYEWVVMLQAVRSSEEDLWDTVYQWGSFSIAPGDICHLGLTLGISSGIIILEKWSCRGVLLNWKHHGMLTGWHTKRIH